MSNMIKYVVECDSLYGVISLLILCVLFGLVVILLYKATIFVAKCITKYKDVHAKASVSDVSFEAALHR